MDMKSLMEMAQGLQSQLKQAQEEAAAARYSAEAGAGMVKVEIDGRYEVQALKIDPSLVEGGDREMLEDLIRAAINSATRKVSAAAGSSVGNIGQSLGVDMSSILEGFKPK